VGARTKKKREEMNHHPSLKVSRAYYHARQKLLPAISIDPESQRWKPFRDRIYIQCIPLDSSADILPFGLHLPGKRSLDDRFQDSLGTAHWNLHHYEMHPQGLAILV